MRRPSTVALVDDDNLDAYLEAVETFTTTISEVDGLTYEARTDFASTETFSKGDTSKLTGAGNDYLALSKISVVKVRDALDIIVGLLHL